MEYIFLDANALIYLGKAQERYSDPVKPRRDLCNNALFEHEI